MLAVLKCPSCGRGYPTRWRLRRHIRTHVPDVSAAFALASSVRREPTLIAWHCLSCSRRFGSARGLAVHVRLAHHDGTSSPEPASQQPTV